MSPPDTGASTDQQFLDLAAAKISLARSGWLLVISTVTELGFRLERMDWGLSKTIDRTSEGWPTMVKTTSVDAARSAGESARFAPWD